MSCLIPPACVFCRHYHAARNERSDALPSCDAFAAIPEEIFMGQFDHSEAFPADGGLRFSLVEADRQDFLDLNAVRRELGLLVYHEPPAEKAAEGHAQAADPGLTVLPPIIGQAQLPWPQVGSGAPRRSTRDSGSHP